SREISEDAGLCHVGPRQAGDLIPFHIALTFEKCKEESLVLDDRTAKPSAVLVAIVVALRHTVGIVEPLVGIECGVVVAPENAAGVGVGSGPGDHRHLTGAT